MKNLLKKFPPGTDLRGSSWDHFAIWGDWMARVDRPSSHSDSEFDPELVARKYSVYLTDVPANPRLLGMSFSFKYGNRSIFEQPFYYRATHGLGSAQGYMREPIDYWVTVPKFSDLTARENSALIRMLDQKGYVEIRKYQLTKSKWAKLLSMSFPATQDLADHDMANAADEAVTNVAWNTGRSRSYETYKEQGLWGVIPGVYATTKKGAVKWIVSRKASKQGL